VIYLDTSVALAYLIGETRVPSPALWKETLVSSRLLEYELWTQVHTRKLTASHGDAVRTLLGEVSMIELHPHVLARALEPFPVPVRTLEALHLASIEFVRRQDRALALASYDDRLVRAARGLGIRLYR